MRTNGYIGLIAGFGLALSLATVWDGIWEGRPGGGDLASELDTFIQEFKVQVAARGVVETDYGIGTRDNGLLRLGAGRCFMQNGAPVNLFSTGGLVSSSGVLTFVGAPLLNNEPNGTIDQGTGRCWIDLDGLDGVAGTSDDNQLNVWIDGAPGSWVVATATPAARVNANLIYNGSFEPTQGTGLLASTVVAQGWTNLNTANIAYDSVNDSTEGDGFAMETIAAIGTDEGASQTLAGLKESKAYAIRARVRPVVGTCDLVVTGGTVTPVSDTSGSATGVFETLEVTATTTAGPADLVVQLESNAIGDECDWDHITAFEASPTVAQPGIMAFRGTGNSDALACDNTFTTCANLATVSVTAPGPGYIAQINAWTTLTCSGAQDAALMRIRDVTNAATLFTTAQGVGSFEVAGAPGVSDQVRGTFLFTTPLTPGATTVLRVDAAEGNTSTCATETNAQGIVLTEAHGIEVLLIPTR